jgi:hypothetical protein
MAEIKNSFLGSKMNKDLDDRLIPNGEYRDAQNISVGKSEADDIGALETVLGNDLVDISSFNDNTLTIIGQFTNEIKNTIIVFTTDYTDPYIDEDGQENPTAAPSTAKCYIHELYIGPTTNQNTWTLLVSGSFLNFSTTNLITGVSAIEDLLFFTDNRNQPRKINVKNVAPYYKTESNISVAKYNPYESISLLNKVTTTTATTGASTTIVVASATGIYVGMSVVQYGNIALEAKDYIYVTTVVGTTITINQSINIIAGDITFLSTTMTGENITLDFNGGVAWPGDPDYIESKFVRFSYRFKFDDGEYSIMAPFTQVAFIPKQKGYFLGAGGADPLNEDENSSFRSTILEFMENGVQDVNLLIPFPDSLDNVNTSVDATYKIQSVDILYKESDGLTVKVLETITQAGNSDWSGTSSILTYDYRSTKPFKSLPSNQITRVYDKVPVKAFAQETAGNRIIYGNFKNKYTPPRLLNYLVAVGPKNTNKDFDSWVEYPNHSVKQNRNYQVGFVLADKYGRQSDVILSMNENTVNVVGPNTFGGSTVFNPYNTEADAGNYPIRDWFGDSLKVQVDATIDSGGANSLPKTSGSLAGEPGLYAVVKVNSSNVAGFDVNGGTPTVTNNSTTPLYRYAFTPATITTAFPSVGNYLRGEYKDFVKVITTYPPVAGRYTVDCDGAINKEIYEASGAGGADVKFAYNINTAGWYSYKIVVKQQEQDYYNVYLPGIVNGYFGHTEYFGETGMLDEVNKTAFTTLFGDNINKIPRDLSEVGPEQKQYRSSVKLSGRVTNILKNETPFVDLNKQFFPGITTHSVDAIGTEEVIVGNNSSTTAHPSIYQGETDPYLVRLTTNQSIGREDTQSGDKDFPVLSIYETDPVESLLDIFYETTSVGLIADLNAAILTSFQGAVGWGSYSWVQPESLPKGDAFISNVFPINTSGAPMVGTTIKPGTFNVFDGAGNNVTSLFSFTADSGTGYSFITNPTNGNFVFNETVNIRQFTLGCIIVSSTGVESSQVYLGGNLSNSTPIINGGVALPAIATNTTITGPLATITGTNGSSSNVTGANTQQLKWSITAGNTVNSFSINANTGVLSKNSSSSPSGPFTLTIRLEDANGNTINGSSFIEASQTINVASVEIGAYLNASPGGVQSQSCNASGALNPNCGTVLYYNNGSVSNPNPTQNIVVVGDVIRTGPNGTNSPVAPAFYYSYRCNQTGSGNRRFFQINNSNGIVSLVDQC